MFNKIKIDKKYIQISIVTIITAIILLFVYRFSAYADNVYQLLFNLISQLFVVLQPVIISFVIAYILYRPLIFIRKKLDLLLTRLTKRRININILHFISILILLTLVFWISSILIRILVPPIISNIEQLIQSAPEFQKLLDNWMQELTKYVSDDQIANISALIASSIQSMGTLLLSFLTGAISNLTGFILDTIVIFILTFYFLKDKETIFNNLNKVGLTILPAKWLIKIKLFLKDLHEIFGNYIVGQLLSACMVGIATTVLLYLIGHPFALIIGLLAGITNVIPYIGAFVGSILGFTLGLFSGLDTAILSLAVLIGYNQLDGYFIQPKILGDKVGLPPVWIFLSILIGGNFFGALGMVLAVPTAAMITLFLKRRYYKLNTK